MLVGCSRSWFEADKDCWSLGGNGWYAKASKQIMVTLDVMYAVMERKNWW